MGLQYMGLESSSFLPELGGGRANILSALVPWIRASLKAPAEEHHIRKASFWLS